MARKPKRQYRRIGGGRRFQARYRKSFVTIPFSNSVVLDTLADNTVLLQDLTGSLGEDLFWISLDISASIRGLTAGQGDPMTLIAAHGDYTSGEVLEALDVTLVDPDDKIEQERARRLVRKVGVFQQEGQMDDTFTGLRMKGPRGGGSVIRQKTGWSIGDGHAPAIGLHNRSGAALSSGAVMEFDGNIYGRWQR